MCSSEVEMVLVMLFFLVHDSLISVLGLSS